MVRINLLISALFAMVTIGVVSESAQAQNRELPYWATIAAGEVNMRVGPSRDYPIDWVYKRKGLPVKVVRVREGWRLVQDPEGAQGWIVEGLLSAERGVLVTEGEAVELRSAPETAAEIRWRAQPGVVGKLLSCKPQWCEIDIAGRTGWVEKSRLWGTDDSQ